MESQVTREGVSVLLDYREVEGHTGHQRRSRLMSRTVIVSGARTPIGKLSGAFASLSAQDLGEIGRAHV